MKKELLYCLVLLLCAVFIGCDSGDNPTEDESDNQGTENQNQDWLVRANPLDSTFTPTDIESTLDDLASALNDTTQVSDMKLSVIPKELGSYFESVVLGANRAIAELGVFGSVVAPNSEDDLALMLQQQIDYVNQHTADGYAGIGLASFGSDLVPAIDAAVDAGVIVVTFDSDEATSKRQLYIGTINYDAGKTGGQTLVDLIGDNPGTVIILGQEDSAWAGGYERTQGAKEVIEAAGHTVVIRQADWADQPSNVTFMTDALNNANPPAVGMLGVFSNAYLCAEAAEAAGVIDDVKIAAFDFEPDTLEYMEAGKIQATHTQRQYYMGYLLPYVMYASTVLGLDETKDLLSDLIVDENLINTGLDVVGSDKIDEYNEFLDSLGIL